MARKLDQHCHRNVSQYIDWDARRYVLQTASLASTARNTVFYLLMNTEEGCDAVVCLNTVLTAWMLNNNPEFD